MNRRLRLLILCVMVCILAMPTTAFGAIAAKYGFSSGYYDETGLHQEDDEGFQYPDYSKFSKGTVYISISENGEYVTDVNGDTVAYMPVDLKRVSEEVNLEDYGLEDFSHYRHDDSSQEKGELPSLLHLYIYFLTNHYEGGNQLEITGSSDSMYMKNGFWGHDENLTYYVNGKYPLFYEGWGATADGIFLEDGDYVDIQMYDDWSFWSDNYAGYHYFTDDKGKTAINFETKVGRDMTIGMGRAWDGLDGGGSTTVVAEENYGFYYSDEAFAENPEIGTIENGKAVIKFDKPGTYYLWASGATGESGESIVSSPAFATVTVKDCGEDHSWDEGEVKEEATCSKEGKVLYTCEYCGQTKEETIECNDAHKTVKVPAVKATYGKEGRRAHFKCQDCNKLFMDSDGKVRATDKDIKISKKVPPKTTIKSISRGKRKFTVKWDKKADVSGYQVRYSTKSSMSGYKVKSAAGYKTVSKKVKSLKSNKKYYVQVRTYVKSDGKTYYSSWSKAKSIKTR